MLGQKKKINLNTLRRKVYLAKIFGLRFDRSEFLFLKRVTEQALHHVYIEFVSLWNGLLPTGIVVILSQKDSLDV